MLLDRYHGLGNDYLVLREGSGLTSELVRHICDRHRGVGGDGILEPFETHEADAGVRIWNPDGSQAEKSGNGLRIFAQWCVDQQRLPSKMSLWTGHARVGCVVERDTITVEMGQVSFEPGDVPCVAEAPWLDARLPGGPDVPACAVGVGNPHCVLFVDAPLDELGWDTSWQAWGARIERHAMFPQRTNVQFARVIDRRAVEIRIWERGAGETSASGSSSCAVAAAGVRTGRLDAGDILVQMPGGTLEVVVRTDGSLRLRGPVERVGAVEVDAAWLAARAAASRG
jgi:diaminopimelate epimerase